jgi:predicted nucleic acid-binding protein
VTIVLPDTSVWARVRQPAVAQALAQAVEDDQVVVTTTVVLELLRGARDRAELEQRARRYDALARVPISDGLEDRARVVQASLSSRGYHRGPSASDLLIAAAAEAVGAELWHCDRHFDLIAEVTGQRVRRVGR